MPPPDARPSFMPLRLAVGGLLVIGLLSRFLGLAREIIIAGTFGTSPGLDAVYLGLAIPLALCLGLGGGTGRAIVPAGAALTPRLLGGLFLQALRRQLLLTIPLAVLLLLTAGFWADMLVPAGSALPWAGVAVTVALGGVAVIGGALGGLAAGIANAHGHHLSANVTGFFHNVTIIACVLILSPILGPLSLLAGFVLAEWVQLLPLLPFLRKIIRAPEFPRPHVLRRVEQLFWPAVLLATTGALLAGVDRYFATWIGPGGVSALAYAERLINFPVLLVGLAVQAPLFTRLASFAGQRRRRAYEATLLVGIQVLLLIGGATAAITASCADTIVALLLERGAFTAQDTAAAAQALRGYAPAIPFLSMVPLLSSAALALKRPWRLAGLYGLMLVLNALLDAAMVLPLGLLGLALSTSAVALVGSASMARLVAPDLFRRPALRRTAGSVLLFSLLAGATALGVQELVGPPARTIPGLAVHLGLSAGSGLLAGALITAPLLRREWRQLARLRARAARASLAKEQEAHG